MAACLHILYGCDGFQFQYIRHIIDCHGNQQADRIIVIFQYGLHGSECLLGGVRFLLLGKDTIPEPPEDNRSYKKGPHRDNDIFQVQP